MNKIAIYEAFDGTFFRTPEACHEYELKKNYYERYNGIKFYNNMMCDITHYLYEQNDDFNWFIKNIKWFSVHDTFALIRTKEFLKGIGMTTDGIDKGSGIYWYNNYYWIKPEWANKGN